MTKKTTEIFTNITSLETMKQYISRQFVYPIISPCLPRHTQVKRMDVVSAGKTGCEYLNLVISYLRHFPSISASNLNKLGNQKYFPRES